MISRKIARAGALLAVVLGGTVLSAEEAGPCRVRLVRATAAEKVAASVVQEVARWVETGREGCRLVSSMADADLVLELSRYRFAFSPDGTPIETWEFVARRLDAPLPARAVRRFALSAIGVKREAKERLSARLPVLLSEILGRRPPPPPPYEEDEI